MQVGQKVKWKSSCIIKQGEIVAVVNPNEYPTETFERLGLHEKGMRFNAYGGGMPRSNESFLVALHETKKVRTQKLYWPLVSLLKSIDSFK
ncbi:MAG: hypothetical protein WC389_06630 [Lutibacter sp.]|jgi:hypothetical protein